jgi:hypothetical protein
MEQSWTLSKNLFINKHFFDLFLGLKKPNVHETTYIFQLLYTFRPCVTKIKKIVVWQSLPNWRGTLGCILMARRSFSQESHVDAGLGADTRSTWLSRNQWSPAQAIPQIWPPSSRITEVRHHSQSNDLLLYFNLKIQNCYIIPTYVTSLIEISIGN